MTTPEPSIKQAKVLVAEGKDECELALAVLASLKLTDVQVIDGKGKDNLKSRIKQAFKEPAFPDVTHFAIFLDADGSYQDCFKSIAHLFNERKLPFPEQGKLSSEKDGFRTSIWISPDNASAGMLEDMFLHCIADEPLVAMATSFVEQLAEKYPSTTESGKFGVPSHKCKAISHACLTATNGPLKHLGVSAKTGHWDVQHDRLKAFRDFLSQAFS